MCFAPQRRALFRHLNLQKWPEHVVLCTFWLGNVLRATTAHTLSTSQLPNVVRSLCFVHFDWEMCFAPQRRTLFRPRNCQKWSGACVLYVLTWKCASHHHGVHLFDISTSTSGPLLWCFVHFDLQMCFAPQRRAISAPAALASLLFDPPEPQIIGKNTVNRDFPIFSHICIFFLLIFLFWLFSPLLFNCPYCRKLHF